MTGTSEKYDPMPLYRALNSLMGLVSPNCARQEVAVVPDLGAFWSDAQVHLANRWRSGEISDDEYGASRWLVNTTESKANIPRSTLAFATWDGLLEFEVDEHPGFSLGLTIRLRRNPVGSVEEKAAGLWKVYVTVSFDWVVDHWNASYSGEYHIGHQRFWELLARLMNLHPELDAVLREQDRHTERPPMGELDYETLQRYRDLVRQEGT